ncbi:FecR family protein [Larkinella bovis]|uniref:FecR family protein n=1 Tax=Larkinella bovis TaxID=683041 RepID=A0ABW0IAG3_9BACT
MKENERDNLEAFLTDSTFRQWVLQPTPEVSTYWEQWSKDHPAHQELLNQARTVLQTLEYGMGPRNKDAPHMDAGLESLLHMLDTSSDRQAIRIPVPWYRGRWSRLAAVIALVVGIGWMVMKTSTQTTHNTPSGSAGMQVITNDASLSKVVVLPDGSIATMEKDSRVKFQGSFTGHSRHVEVEGDVFFDVAPNKEKPFLVYASTAVIKVVGTSFRVRASQKDSAVLVAVKTGKVAVRVQMEGESKKGIKLPDSGWVNLIPNERLVYTKLEAKLTKDRVPDREIIISKLDQQVFHFEEAPVADVLEALANHYHITIEFNPSELANSRITTEFREEGLRQKLDVICEAIDASYQATNNLIVIKRSSSIDNQKR